MDLATAIDAATKNAAAPTELATGGRTTRTITIETNVPTVFDVEVLIASTSRIDPPSEEDAKKGAQPTRVWTGIYVRSLTGGGARELGRDELVALIGAEGYQALETAHLACAKLERALAGG
jgi:hypothetical protein